MVIVASKDFTAPEQLSLLGLDTIITGFVLIANNSITSLPHVGAVIFRGSQYSVLSFWIFWMIWL